ncbi:hypothetical protein GCM10023258_26040 [Terrabacter aeriphilus]|uniref:Uncharacterized protein n=1 Tax=Terrabacter aeriphilus TaxID=515662 RepID=A0ABP9JHA0_9MICO
MSEPTKPDPNAGQEGETGTTSGIPTQTVGARWWFIPAITFLVGLLLGGVVIGVLRPGTPDATAGVSPSSSAPTSDAGPTGTRAASTATVVVPAECLEVAQDSQSLVELTKEAAGAARDLDAGKLSEVVRQIDTAQTTLRTHADACRAVDASLTSGATPSVTTSSDVPVGETSGATTSGSSSVTATPGATNG